MKYLLSIFIIIIHIVMIGCSQKVVYKEVKVPITCDITIMRYNYARKTKTDTR